MYNMSFQETESPDKLDSKDVGADDVKKVKSTMNLQIDQQIDTAQSVSSFTLEELSQYNEAIKDKYVDKHK